MQASLARGSKIKVNESLKEHERHRILTIEERVKRGEDVTKNTYSRGFFENLKEVIFPPSLYGITTGAQKGSKFLPPRNEEEEMQQKKRK